MILPFQVSQAVAANRQQTHKLDDGLGNTLVMPRYNSLTWEENYLFNQYSLIAQKDDSLSDQAYRTEVVVLFLRSRFSISDDVPKEQLLQIAEDKQVSQPMIDAIYEFFHNERRCWQTEDNTSPKKPEAPQK